MDECSWSSRSGLELPQAYALEALLSHKKKNKMHILRKGYRKGTKARLKRMLLPKLLRLSLSF